MQSDSRHAKLADFVSAFSHHLEPLTRDAPNSPACFIHASMAGSRSTAPSSSRRFHTYMLIPGRNTSLILHGMAETLGLDAELA
jgi:hypothetical protein